MLLYLLKMKVNIMASILTDKEIKKLINLGSNLKKTLSCNANGDNIPCRTDRLQSVNLMKEYLEIHNYSIKDMEDFETQSVNRRLERK